MSLSSGESEFYAPVKGGAMGLGLQAMLDEWQISRSPPGSCCFLTSPQQGEWLRRGLGKTRHVQTRYLWIQERVQNRDVEVQAVGTDRNLAKLCTKPLPADVCRRHMDTMGQVITAGRSLTAKQLV